ncbi:MAG: fumarylacetoacetate hydrolase family protein [Proteobacteria bacterium]|nr:fumarylacetoacetate hydrolase family protein [Pseudomonadota bacterium]
MLERSASTLRAARRSGTPVECLEELRNQRSIENAYKVQELFGAMHGATAIGYKVGAASEPSQQLVGAAEPFYGLLFDAETFKSGTALHRGDFFEPGMEGEFAFRIGRDLTASRGPLTFDEVSDAIEAVMPAIEICDHRFKAWKAVSLEEIIADNAFHGALVLGQPMADWRKYDYPTHEISLSFDGDVVGRGPGALVLGHPVRSVMWLANKLSQHGKHLRAGDIVAAGTCTGLHYSGDVNCVSAALGEIGEVSFYFD